MVLISSSFSLIIFIPPIFSCGLLKTLAGIVPNLNISTFSLISPTFSFKGKSFSKISSNSENSSYDFNGNKFGCSFEKKVCFAPKILSIQGDKSLFSKLFLDLIINSGKEYLQFVSTLFK